LAGLFARHGNEGTAELRYTHMGYSLRIYTRESGKWKEETVDGLERNMMFSAEDAARAVEVYEKVYGAKNPPPTA